MVEPHLTEDEQVEKIKSWWKDNGSSVITGAVIGISAVVGYNYWNKYQRTQAENASAYYDQMLNQYSAEESDTAIALGTQLMEEYESTPYGTKAGLMMARMSVEKGDTASAESQLRWTLDKASDDATRHTARLRLAYLLLSTDKVDEAAGLLEQEDMGGFESQYRELQGDVYVQQDRVDDARKAYQASIDTLMQGSRHRQLLELKLNNLGGGDNSTADTSQ